MKKNLKKVFYLLMLGVMMYAPSAMAITCTTSGSDLIMRSSAEANPVIVDMQIPRTVHLVIVVLKIAIPVILVILGMLDLLKGVTASKEDEVKKGQQMFIKRLIAAVLVFFVITIVQLVISFAAKDSTNIMGCAKCFIDGECPVDKE